MLNDARYSKQSKTELASDGPTIHELDTETALTDSLLLSDEATSSDISISDNKTAVNKVKMDNLSSANSLMNVSNALLDIQVIDNTDPPTDEPEELTVPDQLVNNTNLNTPRNKNHTVTDLFIDTRLNEPVSSNEEFNLPETDLGQVIGNKDILQAANEYMDLNTLKCSVFDDTKSSKSSVNPNIKDAMFSHPDTESFQTDKPNTVNEQFVNEEKKSDSVSKNNLTVATRSNMTDMGKFKVNSA